MSLMNYSTAPASIPWTYRDLSGLHTWRWRTERFDAYIKSQAGSNTYVLQVTDLSTGQRNIVLNDMETSFDRASQSIAIFVARAYPRHEYGKYAGDAALTFEIRTGERVNFGRYEGTPSTRVKYLGENGHARFVTGSLQVNHHSIEVTTEDRAVVTLPPQLIVEVKGEFDARTGVPGGEEERIITGRTISGAWKPGCTGRPGFKQDTVEHDQNTPWCPLHRL